MKSIKESWERITSLMQKNSSLGTGTAVTRARITDGLACDISDGAWNLRVDMAEKVGGTATGPDPGVFGRTGLASCLAIGYARLAAVRGIDCTSVTVEVQADYDARGEHGFEGYDPAYREVRYIVEIDSTATPDEVEDLIAEADRCSPWLVLLREPQRVVRASRATD